MIGQLGDMRPVMTMQSAPNILTKIPTKIPTKTRTSIIAGIVLFGGGILSLYVTGLPFSISAAMSHGNVPLRLPN
jgi:hypothetical protein